MPKRRLRDVLFLYVVLSVLQPALFVLVGALHHPNGRGLAFIAVLLVALAFGSRIAWVILLALNALPLLGVLGAAFGSGVLWSHVVVIVLTGVALEATLLSPAMRQHVGSRRNRSDLDGSTTLSV
jgi:hypothetical protein